MMGAAGLLAAGGGAFWLPESRSTFASDVDSIFYVIYWVSVFFFVLILAAAAWFLVKYRRREEGAVAEKSAHHNTLLELVWSGIPLLIALGIFVMGFRGYMDLATPPENAYEIQVSAQKWTWAFTYPNGYVDSELHVPAGTPVKLNMSSQDVIHSFFVPELRVKQDVVPGRYTSVWFNATEPFEATVYCTEYCGTNHSLMQAPFIAHEPADFDAWMQKAARWWEGMDPVEAGHRLYEKRGCVQCHSVSGTSGVGPSFLGSFGAKRQFRDGSTAVMDENYIRESILHPRAKVVAGFDPVMPTFQGRFKDEELNVIIAYIKSLGN
jgi:cytochrome c oxidase subunit 2